MSHNLLAVSPVSTLTGTEFLYIVKDGVDGRIQLNQITAGAAPVQSVAGRIGDVVLSVGDVSGALSTTVAASTYQPLDLDLSNIAALTTTAFGRSFLTQTDAASTKVTLSLNNVDNTSDVNKPVSTATTTALNLKLNLTGGTLSGFLTLHADPTSALHAVTKQYVDNLTIGLSFKNSARAATTTNITLSGTQTIDGVACIVGDRVVVKNQGTYSQNGIYVVASGAWTRALDADTWNELVSAYILIEEGTTNADSGWTCPIDRGGTLGSTDITFAQFSGGGSVSAGYGIAVVGSTVALGNMSANTLYGNNTGSATTPIALTATQVKTFLAIGVSDVSGAAGLSSPTFTGVPLSTTATVNTNTTQIATTAFVLGQASSASPLMDGTVSTGSAFKYAREDHVHPSDTSRVAVNLTSNWHTTGVGQTASYLGWKNYGANHVIIDASAGTAPNGAVINGVTPDFPIATGAATNPATLMGWNGTNTYGVRVDRAQTADNAFLLNGQAASYYATDSNVVHKTGDESITGIKQITGRVLALGTTSAVDGQVQLVVGTPSYDAGASAAGIMFIHNNVAYRGWLGYYSGSSTLSYRAGAGSHAGGTEVFSINNVGATTAGSARIGTSLNNSGSAWFGNKIFDTTGGGFEHDSTGNINIDARVGNVITLGVGYVPSVVVNTAGVVPTTYGQGTLVVSGGIGVAGKIFLASDINFQNDGSAIRFANSGANGLITSNGGALTISNGAGTSGSTILSLVVSSDRKISIGPTSGFVGSATVTYTTASTNTTTGALIVNGGLGVAGTINAGAISTTGTLTTAGVIKSTTIVTTNTTLSTHHIVVGNSATAITVTLPTASSNTGREYIIKNKNAGIMTLDATSAGQLDATYNTTTLPNGGGITVFSDGVTWLRL